ncbi:hypothetical protein ACUOAQ_20495, partial [Escherichia sp. SP-MK]
KIIPAGGMYPTMGSIALTSSDQFASGVIHLNFNQFQRFLNGEPLWVSTSQVDGEYAVNAYEFEDPENLIISEDVGFAPFTNYRKHIEDHTADIIFIFGGGDMIPREYRIAARAPKDLLDINTPSLTLREALLILNDVSLKNDRLFYTVDDTEIPLDESAVQIITDDYTGNTIRNQQANDPAKVQNVYDVVLDSKMNFTIRFADIYDNANNGLNNKIFSWENTKDFMPNSVEPNGYCYMADQAVFGKLKLQAGIHPLEG